MLYHVYTLSSTLLDGCCSLKCDCDSDSGESCVCPGILEVSSGRSVG